MSTGVDDYTLTGPDSSAFCALIQAQASVGPASPSPTQAQFWPFFAGIDSIAYDYYTSISNANVKDWIDKLFGALLQTKTCYGIDAAGMYVLYIYEQFTEVCWDSYGLYTCNNNLFPLNWQQRDAKQPTWNILRWDAMPWSWLVGYDPTDPQSVVWMPPGSPDAFFNAIMQDVNVLNAAISASGGQTDTIGLWVQSGGSCSSLSDLQQFEHSRFDPQNWTDSGQFVQNLIATAIWQQQSAAVTALLQPATLNGDAYFFLLHLLAALGTSTPSDQRLAQQIVSAVATSQEYPNDTFINQLVYSTLMYLNDPSGNFAWTNAQLQTQVDLLAGAITGPDPASQSIRTSLLQHKRVLQTDTAYPMQDPYCPAIGLPERETDTLHALDTARTGLKP